MNEEQPRIARRLILANAQAARLLAGRTEHLTHRVGHGVLVARTRVKSGEDAQLHQLSVRCRRRLQRRDVAGACYVFRCTGQTPSPMIRAGSCRTSGNCMIAGGWIGASDLSAFVTTCSWMTCCSFWMIRVGI